MSRAPAAVLAAAIGLSGGAASTHGRERVTRRLFALGPRAEYAEFHERALFNHILGSIDPDAAPSAPDGHALRVSVALW